MDSIRRNLFDRYVYGKVYPYIGGRCRDTIFNKENKEACDDDILKAFAQQIIELCDALTLDSRNFSDRKIVKERLQQMLQIVCDELGENSQLAMDIKSEIKNKDAELQPDSHFHDSMQRIRYVFALDMEHDTAQDHDS